MDAHLSIASRGAASARRKKTPQPASKGQGRKHASKASQPKKRHKAKIEEVFFALCKSVGSPVSLGAWLRFKYGEHEALAGLSVNAEWYDNAYDFHKDYSVVEFLSKYKGLKTGINTEAVALRKFIAAEVTCRSSNERIQDWLRGDLKVTSDVNGVIHAAARKIARLFESVLQEDGSLNLAALQAGCRWGPGSTYSLRGENAHLDNKICEDSYSITPGAAPYFRAVLSDDLHWLRARGLSADAAASLLDPGFTLVPGGSLTTVPKNAKTDRTIHIEPSGNIFLQLGVGKFIRRQLRRVGINLNDQTVNQVWAQLAYDLGLATVDLSAASDTICREVVYLLLPPAVSAYLDDLRSPAYQVEDQWYYFHKWSSMGNGYTFELETLIFWALAQSVAEQERCLPVVAVYGDDIIIDSRGVPLLDEVFRFLGFTMNQEKTHTAGSFFESCGKHFFRGIDVTPTYQKEIPDVLEEVYRLANRIRRLAHRMGTDRYADSTLHTAWLASVRTFADGDAIKPPHFLPVGTPLRFVHDGTDWTEDDGGLLLSYDEFPTSVSMTGLGMLLFPAWVFKPRSIEVKDHSGLYAYHLRRWWRETEDGYSDTIDHHGYPGNGFKRREWLVQLANQRQREPANPFDGTVSIRRRGFYVQNTRKHAVGVNTEWV